LPLFWKKYVAMAALVVAFGTDAAASDCPADKGVALLPNDPALCTDLAAAVRDPDGLPLDQYETKLGQYLGAFCHRDTEAGWIADKTVRDTGPYVSTLGGDGWQSAYHGTHAPVLIWYSPEAAAWIRENRGADDEGYGSDSAPMPDGAIIVKEMYPAPAARCADVEPTHLLPSSGAAVIVRDSAASQDGWFWGWYGWSGWDPDWPAAPDQNRLAYMGFGQYCVNCHASARDNLTFASARNMAGEPGQPLVFLSQEESATQPATPHHSAVVLPDSDGLALGQPHTTYHPAFVTAFPPSFLDRVPNWGSLPPMPSQTYDNVWMVAGAPGDHDLYVTADQCLGCHDAGSTGLQFDMTEFDPESGLLWNHSPYATWRTSPMGLAGRDPFFFAQLSSETHSFHPDQTALVENTCLGCHGIMGERQAAIDGFTESGACGTFTRADVDAIPGLNDAGTADYGALARDGISCTACHRMVLGEAATAANATEPRNACIEERQALLNPDASGFARTFTGSFMVGPADRLFGPFEEPKTAPMETALGIVPAHSDVMADSELCGTCHTVHLPVLRDGETLAHIYEQTTYPEWAFSDYRVGTTMDGDLPEGAGKLAESCQGCHMPSTDADGTPTLSKIASIQEFSNFPQAEFTKAPDAIDLEPREGFARHDLVGLNVFLIKIAQQFPELLGIRTQDPMLVSMGVDPLLYTEQQMLDQAANDSVKLTLGDPVELDGALRASVTLENLTGHKFPSGVGFRRAFLTFEVVDVLGNVLWASGRTDGAGRLVDASGTPIAGEIWWNEDCSARIEPDSRLHQPHYQRVVAEDQAQIYQELTSTPPAKGPAQCGPLTEPAGQLTTSFLSICAEVKDNRLLPQGFLPLDARKAIAVALGAGDDLAVDVGPTAVGDDPDYQPLAGGKDSVEFVVPLSALDGTPAAVRARLYYQATPPFYLQDRFCTATGTDRDRLYFLTGHLNLEGTEAEGWKLLVADSGTVAVKAE
jgi:hypothetical protein